MAKANSKPRKKVTKSLEEKFGLHLGNMVRQVLDSTPGLTQIALAKKIGIGKQGIYHRLNSPWYGDAYDLIEISLALKTDFITPLQRVINAKGIYYPEKFTQQDMDAKNAEIDHYKTLYERAAKEIEVLHRVLENTALKV